jgi:hypothetical protein
VDEAGAPVPFVGFDGKDMGKKVGEAAGKLLTEAGWLNDSAKKVGVLYPLKFKHCPYVMTEQTMRRNKLNWLALPTIRFSQFPTLVKRSPHKMQQDRSLPLIPRLRTG